MSICEAEKSHGVRYYLKPKCLHTAIANILGGIGHDD